MENNRFIRINGSLCFGIVVQIVVRIVLGRTKQIVTQIALPMAVFFMLFSCTLNTSTTGNKTSTTNGSEQINATSANANDLTTMNVNNTAPLHTNTHESLNQALEQLLTDNKALGAALLVRKGEHEIYYGEVGYRDRESQSAWTRDTLVNIYSMTKPVTGITLMTLYEEGLFELDDPVEKYLPEFSSMQVYEGLSERNEPILVPADRKVTIIDLMRHTAGLGYGYEGNYPADIMRNLNPLDANKPLAQMSEEIASAPLYFQPGAQWQYSTAVDIQARLAEVLSGQPYEQLVQERVITPLQMKNTAYYVPAANKNRVSAVYIKNDADEFVREADSLVYGFSETPPAQTSGGSGLISTIDDYMRFAQMLQNEGTLDGVTIVKPETIRLMSQDHLPDNIGDKSWLPGKGQLGFGIDFAVRIAPPVDEDELYGKTGEFFWDGRATTLFWIDPANDVTVIFFTQVVPFDLSIHADIRKAVYQALNLYSFE